MDKQSEKFVLSSYKYDKGKSSTKQKRIMKTWNLTFDNSQSNQQYVTCFGLGYARYYLKNEIYQQCTQYVPIEDSLKVSIIKLKNTMDKDICLKIKYDLDLQIGENSEDKRFVVNVFKESLNMNLYKNIKNNSGYVYVTSSEKINQENAVNVWIKQQSILQHIMKNWKIQKNIGKSRQVKFMQIHQQNHLTLCKIIGWFIKLWYQGYTLEAVFIKQVEDMDIEINFKTAWV